MCVLSVKQCQNVKILFFLEIGSIFIYFHYCFVRVKRIVCLFLCDSPVYSFMTVLKCLSVESCFTWAVNVLISCIIGWIKAPISEAFAVRGSPDNLNQLSLETLKGRHICPAERVMNPSRERGGLRRATKEPRLTHRPLQKSSFMMVFSSQTRPPAACCERDEMNQVTGASDRSTGLFHVWVCPLEC